jgi:FtsP/CotA-like multicopper oxidase with cupredoxin domain
MGVIANSPAASFEATRGIPTKVTWVNDVTADSMFAVDPTIMYANSNGIPTPTAPFTPYPPGYPCQSNVPLVPHLHGGEVQSYSDGGPNSWWTATGTHGPTYSTLEPAAANAAVYYYPNAQSATTLWYHDHAMGMTRINVMSGLAGFYLLRDAADPIAPLLPSGQYEIPLAIQDRTFNTDGSLWFPSVGINPTIHPYWFPEFFGNTIMVNGLVWPNMNVDKGQYMFRVLDGSNARFYNLYFSNGMPFTVIGTEGGYMKAPVSVTKLLIAPGERYVILVDFSSLPAGTMVKLLNNGKAPYPSGRPAQGATTGQIMQFTVTANKGPAPALLPSALNPTLTGAWPSLGAPSKTRILTLYEIAGPLGPLMVTLNGQRMDAPVSEAPVYGTTEDWQIVDTTMDAHPIHLHLVTFQLVYRQNIDMVAYTAAWIALNGAPPYTFTPKELSWAPYVTGKPIPATPIEQAWKDTIQVYPGQVSVFRIRFAPNDGSGQFSFDPTLGPGYVWHCHIIDHEDNEMMRPYMVVKPV